MTIIERLQSQRRAVITLLALLAIGGIVAACRQLKTRKGDRMAVFTLEDAQGSVEIVAFPEAYSAPPG